MSNDTTTLNGALAELGETMATNITAKGVSASASDGLTTLAGKISQISQSGGGTPVVEFDNTNFGTHFAFTRPGGNYKDTFTIHVPSGTTHLVEYCFYYLKNLTGIDLPTGLTDIGQYAFYYCEGLTEAEIPNTVATIGQNAFCYCTSLQSVNIPTSLSSIPTNCFRYSGLTSVTIPSNITSMNNYAFGNCSNLETIHFDSATPPTVTSSTFQNLPTTCVIEVPCDSLSLYTSASNYPSSSTYTYVPYGCNGLKFLQDSYTTSTGTCEVSLRLWDNNAPVSGGTITITGSDSSSYTCTTDSNGEATCTLTNISGTVTFTATYGNYSDTATVTVKSYIVDISGMTDQSNEFGSILNFRSNGSSGSGSMSYDSTNQYYVFASTSTGQERFIPITALTGLNDFQLTFEAQVVTTHLFGFGEFVGSTNTNCSVFIGTDDGHFKKHQRSDTNITTGASSATWYKFIVTVDNTGYYVTIKDLNDNVKVDNYRCTISNSNTTQYGFTWGWEGTSKRFYLRNIKAEAI